MPEGIIFQSGKSHVQLRKNLVQDGLYAVVSLPSGVFAPYSGVKTSILFFDNELAKQRSEILFVKVQYDGFDPGATKRQISKNDLPIALEILCKWRAGQTVEHPNALYVGKLKITENGDYNLSGERYHITSNLAYAKWPIVRLGDVVLEMKDGGTPSRSKAEYFGGDINWAVVKDITPEIYSTREHLTNAGLSNSSANIWPVNSVIISLGATIGNVGIAKVPPATKQGLSGIIVDPAQISSKYLYYILVDQRTFIQSQATGASIKEVRPSRLQQILTVPLPPLEIQEQIVAELDGYAAVIAGAKQIVANWKPKIDIDPGCEKVRLGDVFNIESGGTPSSTEKTFWNGNIKWVTLADIPTTIETISDTQRKITAEGLRHSSAKLLPKGTVMVSSRATIGRIAITGEEMATNQGFKNLIVDINNEPIYVAYALSDRVDEMLTLASGGIFKEISKTNFSDLEIHLPPIFIQKQIVEHIEAERALVESAKKLSPIYEQKSKEVIAKLWSQ